MHRGDVGQVQSSITERGGDPNDDRGLFLGLGLTNSIQDKSAPARRCRVVDERKIDIVAIES